MSLTTLPPRAAAFIADLPRRGMLGATRPLAQACGLAALLALAIPCRAVAQAKVQTLEDVVRQIASGGIPDKLLNVLNLDCIDFPVDRRSVARLQAVGAPQKFINALNLVCYKGAELEIRTAPAGATVVYGADTLGGTPFTGRFWPTGAAHVRLIRNNAARDVVVALPAGMRVTVDADLPRDTISWPSVPSPEQALDLLGLRLSYPRVPADPPEPTRPEGGNGYVRFSLGGALLGGLGFAAGSMLCKQTATSNGGYVGGTFYPAGASVDLGASGGCVAGLVAGGAVAGGLVNAWLGARRDDGARDEYAKAMAARPAQLADLQRRREAREAAIEADSSVRTLRENSALQWSNIRSSNGRIAAENRALANPVVSLVVLDSARAAASGGGAGVVAGGAAAASVTAVDAATGDADATASDSVDLQVPHTGRVNDKAVAVVIGNRRYAKKDIPSVDFAVNDARTMRRYLVETFGFREENIIFEENATYSTLARIFGAKGNERGQLFNFVAPDSSSDVVIFYSGHGAPDPTSARAFLVPSDADPQLLAITGYSLDVLYENIAKVPARSLTIYLDACFSGNSDRGMLFKGVSPALLRVESPILAARNATLFAAATNTQVSGWLEPKRHGLFTYWLLRGLQGAADADGNGALTATELHEYVRTNVLRMSRKLKNREQTPTMASSADDRVLLRWNR